ncbi:unnamed protein product, partial [marine sediment metagenome]
MSEEISRTLSEYVLLPGYIPEELKAEGLDLSTYLTRYKLGEEESAMRINTSILSAAMQCVTGPEMSIALARLGALGVIPRSQLIESQAQMIRDVKRHKAGFVTPETVLPDASLEYVQQRMEETGYSKFPVLDPQGKLLG